MKKLSRVLMVALCVVIVLFFATSLKAEAGNITSGTLGDNGGIEWTYDADTKTLTITGEDSGVCGSVSGSPFKYICSDVEKIIVHDCILYYGCESLFHGLQKVRDIKFINFDTSNVTNMEYMFCGCISLEKIDLSGFNTSQVTSFNGMFATCWALTEINLANVDTSQVTNMNSMFAGCKSIESIDVSRFDTSNVEDMLGMFAGCYLLKEIDVSGFDTSKVTMMNGMFNHCDSLVKLDLSNFDTTNVKDMRNMFSWCERLEEVNLSSFDLSKTEYLEGIFEKSNALEQICTPKAMTAEQSIKLTSTFVDEQGNQTNSITKAFCNKILQKKSIAQVKAFVERMYTIVLGRAAEEQGLSEWTARLMAKEIDGATLVDMFVNSDEFINRNTSDEEYIKILYHAVLGREADADGLKMWKDMLADDWTRDYILEGLVLSTEFKSICDSYGIIAAFDPTAESQVRSFVKRMYTVVLNRRADAVGLEDWTKQLMNGTVNGARVADGFINSQEFANRNLSNEKYVKVLYRAFFNREPDEGGFNVWMNELAKGTSRREVMKGFVHSVEFSDLCASYGIIRGEIH